MPDTDAEVEEWHREQNTVVRSVTVDFLKGGAFNLKEGDYHAVLSFDEMVGWMAHAGVKHLPQWKREAPTLYPTDQPK